MKIKIHCIILLGILLMVNSCKEDPNEYFSEQRSNIVGEWTVIETRRAYNEGVFQLEYEENGSNIVFNEDGTGSRINSITAELDEFEWLYQLSPHQIVFHYPVPNTGISTGVSESTRFFNIINNNPTNQSWERESFPLFGAFDRYEHEWEMTKL
jgi:hypothetical protein